MSVSFQCENAVHRHVCLCRYEGDWVDDVPNGKGRVWYSDGAFYEGDVVMFKRQGEGQCTFANGDRWADH